MLYQYHCGRKWYRSIHHLNETIICKEQCCTYNGRACARGIRVNLPRERDREKERKREGDREMEGESERDGERAREGAREMERDGERWSERERERERK